MYVITDNRERIMKLPYDILTAYPYLTMLNETIEHTEDLNSIEWFNMYIEKIYHRFLTRYMLPRNVHISLTKVNEILPLVR